MTTRCCFFAIALAVLAVASPAIARERTAVFFAADDRELADNLVEVAISVLAETRDREIVGQRELQDRVEGILRDHQLGLGACFDDRPCATALAQAARADRMLCGSVAKNSDGFRLLLVLVGAEGDKTSAELSRAVPGDVERLVPAVRDATAELTARKALERPATPAKTALAPIPVPVAAAEEPRTLPDPPPPARAEERRSPMLPIIGYGSLALSVVAFSAAAVAGTLSATEPSGATRAEVQQDLEQHQRYATTANVMFAVGGALAATSVVTLAWSWN